MIVRNRLTLAALLLIGTAAISACSKGSDSGSAQKTTGHVESAVGSLTGDEKLKHDGKKDEVVGGVKSAVGDVKDAVHDAGK